MFKCKICGKICSRKISFKTHITRKHNINYNDYIKKYEKEEYKNNKINEKEEYQKRNFICKICKKRFLLINGLTHHITSIHNIKYNDYLKQYNLSEKIIPDPKNELQCQICGKICKKIFSIHCHVSTIHKITKEDYQQTYFPKLKIIPDPKNELQCQICGKICKNNSGVNWHVLSIHKLNKYDYIKKYLPKIFQKMEIKREQKQRQKEQIKLDIIKRKEQKQRQKEQIKLDRIKRKEQKQRQKEQIKLEMIKNLDKNNQSQCQICGLIVDKNKSIYQHVSSSHKILKQQYIDTYFPFLNIIKCKFCGTTKNLYEQNDRNGKKVISRICKKCRSSSLEGLVNKYGKEKGEYKFYINNTRNKYHNKKEFIEYIKKLALEEKKAKKESMKFKIWVSKYIFDCFVKKWFNNDIENVYNEIPEDIKKSFKNNPRIFKHYGYTNIYNMYTDRGELLKSSGEICFYFLLKENKIDYLVNKHYPNSRMIYDFYLPKYNLYIEIAGSMWDIEYIKKMNFKHQKFGSIILESEEDQKIFIDNLLNKKEKTLVDIFD